MFLSRCLLCLFLLQFAPPCCPSDHSSSETCSSDSDYDSEEETTGVEQCDTVQRSFCIDYNMLQFLKDHLTEQLNSQQTMPTSESMIAEIVNQGFLDVGRARAVVNHFMRSQLLEDG